MANFSTFFFLGNIGQDNVIYDILARKNAFLGYKNKKIKKAKNWHFSKGINFWLWSKNGRFFNCFFLGNIEKENVFYDILERKNAFLGYKDKKFKQSKNWHFLTQGFGPKMAIFPTFFFLGNLGQKNVFNDILEQKTPFQAIKTRSLKSAKIDIFPKRLTHV